MFNRTFSTPNSKFSIEGLPLDLKKKNNGDITFLSFMNVLTLMF